MASSNFSYDNSSEFQPIDKDFVNGIKTRQYVNFWIDTFATLFALIVIIWKSPLEMRTYKWFLLNIVVWSYLMDVNLTVLYVPLSLFPAPIMCILGLADHIENLFYANYSVMFLLIELLGACGAAIVCALYYRYRSVMGQPMDIFHKRSVILGIALFHFANGLPCLIALIYASDQSVPHIHKYLQETFPTAPDLSWLKCGALVGSALSTKIFVALCVTEILLYVLIIAGGSVYVFICFKRLLTKSSEKIRSLERQLIIALFIQATIPFITLVCPYVFMAMSVLFRIKNVVYITSILLEISSLHAFLNVLTMFLTVKAYRDVIKNFILRRKDNRLEGYERNSSDVVQVQMKTLY